MVDGVEVLFEIPPIEGYSYSNLITSLHRFRYQDVSANTLSVVIDWNTFEDTRFLQPFDFSLDFRI